MERPVTHQENPSFNPCGQLVIVGPFYHCPGPSPFVLDPVHRSSISLLQLLDHEGLVPSQQEEIKRGFVVQELGKIVMYWAKRVAYLRRLPRKIIRASSAFVLAYGSYGIRAHTCESDIDAVCIGPSFATLEEDFFGVLRDMLARRPQVSEILCIKDAKVPLMRFNFDGISIDLPYAKLNAPSIPANADILNSSVVKNIDEVSWRSLCGVRSNRRIYELVPDLMVYQSLMRCIKFWAKRRGIYGYLLGFFGGIHLSVLATLICVKAPRAPLCVLVSTFFRTYASWPWPKPVMLEDGVPPNNPYTGRIMMMPIQLPNCPDGYCASNITSGTFDRITGEFRRAHSLTKDVLRLNFDWEMLFEPFPYAQHYQRFLRIRLSSRSWDELRHWVGWVKSRMHYLFDKLEELQGFCDPNPTEYVDADLLTPNTVFYWGLNRVITHIDVDAIKGYFGRRIYAEHKGPLGEMELAVVAASELPNHRPLGNIELAWVRASGKPINIMDAMYSKHNRDYVVGYSASDGISGQLSVLGYVRINSAFV